MPNLTYVNTRLEISLGALAVTALFEESDQGLDGLSDTLTTIVTDDTLSELYTTAALDDILEIYAYTPTDHDLKEVIDDFNLLTALVRDRINRFVEPRFGKLRAIHLEPPDLLVLEFCPLFAGVNPKILYRNRIDINTDRIKTIKEYRCRH